MSKGQKRSAKETRKPKAAGKKPEGPKYLRPAEMIQPSKLGASPGRKR